MTHTVTAFIAANPIISFTLLLLTSLIVPPVFEKLKLPGLVGLLLAGVVLGPHALQLLDPKTETIKLLSDIGKIYLMFIAGLEIDIAAFRRTRNHSLSFGLSTFLVPLLTGIWIGIAFGFGPNASVLIGSLLASHTLLAYPIVQRLGIVKNQAVTITIGATIFTDIGALLVLAVCISIHQGEFSWWNLGIRIASLAIYSVLVLWGIDHYGKEYFRRTGNEEGNQFLFTLLALFLASVGAQLIQIENIVGAFLAGLAVNDVLGKGVVKEKVEFVGGVLFIPFFFVAMGLLINIPVFIQTLFEDSSLVIAIVLGLCGSKFLAAFVIKNLFHYDWDETMTMWSLSLPQVAATLAAAFVGFEAGLLNEALFNSVIVLMLVTSTIGPIITQRFATKLAVRETDSQLTGEFSESDHSPNQFSPENPLRVIVPVYNPSTEAYLIEMAGLLVKSQGGMVLPLAIAQLSTNLSEPEFAKTLARTRLVLEQATNTSNQLGITNDPILRIDNDVALGITYSAREQNANLILMGYQRLGTIKARLLGNIIEQVLRASHCPVVVMRLLANPSSLKSILVPFGDLSLHSLDLIMFAQFLAKSNQGKVTCLWTCPLSTTPDKQAELKSELRDYILKADIRVNVEVIATNDQMTAILVMSRSFDLILLNALDFQPTAGIIVSDWGTPVLNQLDCSLVLFKDINS
ncbi:cation:proton antiporter [Gloeocapsa sp. PCC 73106]|uniref:cation:proton antiporter n=1 Tax=Gloeocapsa sp. PCC 73106 TaxID=102232 RepID=UPI0002AC9102|nr:cation:proton antiporter [Gloeocapsa sp. PCC 73106]ELR99399.1 Kef-type K+ transport system, membrane component [Gloeocapsa sp. PCC 73106]